MALPTAIFAMMASFGLASAAVLSSVDAQRGTKRDQDSKRAIAAADAAASMALLRLNRFQNSLTEATPCVGPGGELQSASGGWCPATPSEGVGGATFSYSVSAFEDDAELSVIAVGASGEVSRRIEVGLISYNGKNVFFNDKLIGENDIVMEGTPHIETSVGTNGSIESDGTGTICGNVRHGTGQTVPEGQPKCGGDITEGDVNLPPVGAPEDIATNNDNCRLEDPRPEGCNGVDTYTKQRTSTNPWDPKTRTINIAQNAALTMGGERYLVCGLTINSGQLIMAANAHVQIFIDTPENCGLSPGATQVRLTGNAEIKSTGYNPDEENYVVPEIYVLGSPTISTSIDLGGNAQSTNELMLYAPYSDITISGNATWIGMMAGSSLRMNGGPTLKSDPGIAPPDITLTSLWERTRFVECTGASASPPDASC